MTFIERLWYREVGWHWLWYWLVGLLALLFSLVAALRRTAYRQGWLTVTRLNVPVIVVGNITVGGSGKTPFTLWLVEHLRRRGFKPGIVSRGYGGRSAQWPRQVSADSDPAEVGDEPVLLARRLACPIVVAPRRVDAVLRLLEAGKVDIVVADDGLQHYALGRDIEIAVVDGERGAGNGYALPAGPLREPVSRLQEVDMVVVNGGPEGSPGLHMTLAAGEVRRLDGSMSRPMDEFLHEYSATGVHAVAGIGNPGRFFADLRRQGINVTEHAFPDHYSFRAEDIVYNDNRPVLMTEKDAVKCRSFAGPQHWYVTVNAVLDVAAVDRVDELLQRLKARG